jgi:hypothetical protein
VHSEPLSRFAPARIERASAFKCGNSASFQLSKTFRGPDRVVDESLPESRRWIWIGPGDNRARTGNLRRAKAALSQLSYVPARSRHRSKAGPEISGLRGGSAETARLTVGLARIELATSRLSGVRSNHLSYRPGVA